MPSHVAPSLPIISFNFLALHYIAFQSVCACTCSLFRLVPQAAGTCATADKPEQGAAESDDEPDPPEKISVVVPCPGLLLEQVPGGENVRNAPAEGPVAVATTALEQITHAPLDQQG